MIFRIAVATVVFAISTIAALAAFYYTGSLIFDILPNAASGNAQVAFGVFIILPITAIFFVGAFGVGAYIARATYRKMRGERRTPDATG